MAGGVTDKVPLALLLLQTLTTGMAVREDVSVRVRVPTFVELGKDVKLECDWRVPKGKLYSLKWYLDDQEFYSFKPQDRPPIQLHSLPGITVDQSESNEEVVVLRKVLHKATGKYKCEVISDSPEFFTADKGAHMTVVKIPTEKPTIYGTKHEYHIGDRAHLTCTSAPSRPAAILTWYINDEEAPKEYVVDLRTSQNGEGDVKTRKGLQFIVGQQHFREGQMNLRCSARISGVYYKTQQHSVDGHHSYSAPVMESRDYSARAGSSSSITFTWTRQVPLLLLASSLALLTPHLLGGRTTS